MTKAELRVLERIYGAEIDGALSKQPIRGIYQTRPTKMIRDLKEQGMVIETEWTLGGQFPVVVRGWCLTPLGHLTYCMACDDKQLPQQEKP